MYVSSAVDSSEGIRIAVAAIPSLLFAGTAFWLSFTRLAATVIWRIAHAAAALAVVASLVSLAWLASSPLPFIFSGPTLSVLGASVLGLSLRVDALGGIVATLVAFIGWVIVRYSRTYLAGEARERSYAAWLMATLAAVSVVILTNNLFVLALAWTATSLSLHHLLTFYPDRPAALIVAHKKFLCSRFAEVCLLGSLALIAGSVGTLEIDQVMARAKALGTFPLSLQAGVVLLALAALLKCAQLPFHGWLIQVMEAPTPVSALLHAGVVNLGGFVLIRLAVLVSGAPAAQALLVVVGTATAVLAALVTTTRISIKVQLAWSTCAQMGFMLMQCGLGAYDLALLHLVAHSLYKAHAFLSAGAAVRRASIRQLTASAPPVPIADAIVGAATGLAMVALAGWAWGVRPSQQPTLCCLAAIVALALTPLLSGATSRDRRGGVLLQLVASLAIAFVYFGLHALFAGRFHLPSSSPAPWLLILVVMAFLALFVLQTAIAARPAGRLVRSIYPWFYAGLHLDERFSRLAFALWPPRLARTTSPWRTEAAPGTPGGALS